MVQFANPGNLRPESELPFEAKGAAPVSGAVKLEIEDPLEDEFGPLNKRSKFASPFEQWSTEDTSVSSHSVHYNPLNEPSPLGLRLRKSPSLLDLIQMRLSKVRSSESCVTSSGGVEAGKKKDLKSTGTSATADKLKASNFPANLLKIGTWECISRYEGDLVAKCYFAKHKLVWEVLDGSLKSKIEIQWSDITALKTSCPENGPGTLDIVLARQPLFFRETNPQPRKHTLWQATSDFTGGQASMHRRHILQCPQGLLNKHFEKLIQCDPRLNSLSRQPEIILDSPYFEPRCSMFEDQDETKCHVFDQLKGDYTSSFSGFQDAGSPCASLTSLSTSEIKDRVVRASDPASLEATSPSSVMDSQAMEENVNTEREEHKVPISWDRFNVPGLHPSMSMSDLMDHIGHCISEQKIDPNKELLEEIKHHLLSDSLHSAASDDNSLMSRVNSLCCLLQPDLVPMQNLQTSKEAFVPANGRGNEPDSVPEPFERKPVLEIPTAEGDQDEVFGCKQSPSISRKESYGDLLLMNLPRIASLPQFLFNIAEDSENQAR